MSDLNLPEPPAENPPIPEPRAQEPRLIVEIAPTPPGYNRTVLWVIGIFALAAVLLCGIVGLLIASGAAGAIDQLAAAILTPEPTPINAIVPAPVELTAQPPANWTLLYHENFQPRPKGLRSEWQVLEQFGSSALSDTELDVTGRIEAVVGESNWNNYQLSLSGLNFSDSTLFAVYVHYQDSRNTLKMVCAGSKPETAGQECKWYVVVDGETSEIPATSFEPGGINLDLKIDVRDTQINMSATGGLQISFTDPHFQHGKVGLKVDSGMNTFTASGFRAASLPVNDAAGSILFSDSFRTWDTTSSDDEFAATSRNLDGVFRIRATAKQGYFEWSTVPEEIKLPDQFKLSVNVKLVSGATDAAYGLIFRSQQTDSFYRFIVADDGYYRADLFANDQLTDLIDWTDTSKVLPNQLNALEVWGDGDTYTLSVNGHRLDSFSASDLAGGTFGIEYSLYDVGDEIEVEFSDLQMWAP
jgi:hypothetical protein